MLDNDQLLISLSKKTKLGNLSSSQTKQMKLRTLKTTRFMYILKQSSTNTAKKTKTGGGRATKQESILFYILMIIAILSFGTERI